MIKSKNLSTTIYLTFLIFTIAVVTAISVFILNLSFAALEKNAEQITAVEVENKKERLRLDVLQIEDFIKKEKEVFIAQKKEQMQHLANILEFPIQKHLKEKPLEKKELSAFLQSFLKASQFEVYFLGKDITPFVENAFELPFEEELVQKEKVSQKHFITYNYSKEKQKYKKLFLVQKLSKDDAYIAICYDLLMLDEKFRYFIKERILGASLESKRHYIVIDNKEKSFSYTGMSQNEIITESLFRSYKRASMQTIQTALEESQSAYVNYTWQEPIMPKAKEKIAFFKRFESLGFIIGTGFFVEDMQAVISQNTKSFKDILIQNLYVSYIVVLVVVVLTILTSRWILKRIEQSFSEFKNYFMNTKKHTVAMDLKNLKFTEFQEIGDLANQIIENFKSNERFLTAVLNTQKNIIFIYDGHTIFNANKAFFDTFGIESYEEFFTKITMRDHIYNEELKDAILSEFDGRAWLDYITSFNNKSNKVAYEGEKQSLTFAVEVGHIEFENKPLSVISLADITELDNYRFNLEKIIEEKLKKEKKQEKLLIKQAKFASAGEMLSIISHQWRQPLTELSSKLMVLDGAKDTGVLTNDMLSQKIEESNVLIEYMSNTIEDFKNFFKPSGQKDFFDLSKAFDKISTIVTPVIEYNQIEFIVAVDVRERIFGRENDFIQAMVNIITNAVFALTSRKVTDPRIIISCIPDEQYTIIEVSDNAGGISVEPIDQIFEPYVTTKGSQMGTGIGMYIVRTIIESKMSGLVQAHNVDNGALIRLRIRKYSQLT